VRCAGLASARSVRAARVASTRAAGVNGATAALSEEEELEWEQTITRPRVEAGTDVHRRVHALAGKHPAYLFQWRAFCERQKRSWLDARSAEDEAILAGA
jgi:hypothetical protein